MLTLLFVCIGVLAFVIMGCGALCFLAYSVRRAVEIAAKEKEETTDNDI